MPLTGAQLRAQLADVNRNPRGAVAGTLAGGGRIVTLKLRMAGVAFAPELFYDMLVTLYGAGKVSTDLSNSGRNSDHQFTVVP